MAANTGALLVETGGGAGVDEPPPPPPQAANKAIEKQTKPFLEKRVSDMKSPVNQAFRH